MRKFALLLVLLLTAGLAAHADPITTVSMTLENETPNNIASGSPISVYVYPYNFSINGSLPPYVALICDDYSDEVNNNETWNADVFSMADIKNGVVAPDGTVAGQMNPLPSLGISKYTAYEEAVWLYLQLGSNPSADTAAGINYAIWGIFDPNALTNTAYNTYGAAGWLSQAETGYQTLTQEQLDSIQIYTPIAGSQPSGDGRPQEYLGQVPEPGSLMLLGTGLLGLARIARKKLS